MALSPSLKTKDSEHASHSSLRRHRAPPSPRLLHSPQHSYDGGSGSDEFFESLALSLKKHKTGQYVKALLEDECVIRPPNLSKGKSKEKERQLLSEQEKEHLYEEALYTVQYLLGASPPGYMADTRQLIDYLQQEFEMTITKHENVMLRVKQAIAPVPMLAVNVVKARDLLPKDADGFSDPYCMLGIVPVQEEAAAAEGRKERRFSFRRRRETRNEKRGSRETLPAKYIQCTEVKPHTLNPMWNEHFRLEIDDIHKDVLHLDIWDHDDDVSVAEACRKLNEVNSLKGMGRYFKQIVKSARTDGISKSGDSNDDFLGCLNIPLNEIPFFGCDCWYKLEPRTSSSSVQGECRIALRFTTEKRDTSLLKSVTEVVAHRMLLTWFVEHEHLEVEGSDVEWKGGLCQPAITILKHHAAQTGLFPLLQAAMQWQVYSKHCFYYDVSYDHLLDLLQELDRGWETGTLTRQQGEALSATFVMFADNSLEKIHNIREFFPAAEPASLQRLSGLLKCLAFLYNSKIFKQLCVNQNELQLEITCVIKKGTSEWYNSLLSKLKLSSIKESADTLGYLSRLVAAACSDTWQGREYYSGIFNNCVNIDYLSLSYLQLDKLVSEDVGGTMRSMSAGLEGTPAPAMDSKTSDALLGLHACLDELHAYHTSLTSKSENDLALSAFPTWFGPLLTKWLEMARKKAAARIWQAVQTDKLDRIDSQKKCSSSIDEVMNCLSLLREFCLILAPPNSSQQLSQLAEDMCGCILRYTELTKTSLQEGGYYRHDGHFDVTVQLCTALNNVEHTRQFLLKQCQLQQPVEAGVGLRHPEQLDKAVHAAEQGIQHQLDVIVALFAKKMEPDIKKYIKHISLSPDSIHLDDAVSPLMKYLDDNLALLSKSLLIENFTRMLRALWRVIVNLNIDAVAADPPHSPEFFARFHYTMQLLLQFFHADGKGIPIHSLRTEEYMALQVELTQSKQSTQELIECYFVEMLAQQKAMESSRYGTLTVRCVYELAEQKLYVEILSASNLIALDANGLSDPFVIVEVCPPHVAPKARSHKTSVKSKTLHPVFNEQFCFAVPPDCCRKKGACILFTVMDHDWLSRNDFAGEACISLATMTGFGGHIGGAMTARPPLFSLPLSQPQEGRVLKILEERVSDREAQDFIKRRKGLISGALDQ